MLRLFSGIIGGAFTGYFTNNIALKMIFEKIGPFGGVILKNKNEFIDDTSSLVEREIINHKTLEKELEKEKFKEAFNKLISDTLETYIYQNTEDNILWIDVPGINTTINNIENYNQKKIKPKFINILDVILESISVDEILSDKQISNISNKLFDILMNTIDDSNALTNMFSDLYTENSNKEIKDIIHPKILKDISNTFKTHTEMFNEKLRLNFDNNIDEVINSLYKELNIANIIKETEKKIKEKNILDILGNKNTENITNELINRLISFLDSKEGKNLLSKFIDEIFDFLRNLNVSFYTLIENNFDTSLELLIKKNLPSIFSKFIYLIRDNKVELEKLIEDSIDETLNAGSGFKNKIAKIIRKAFVKNVSKKYQIVNRIIKALDDEKNINILSKELTEEIVIWLKKDISEIMRLIEKNYSLDNDFIINKLLGILKLNKSKLNFEKFDSLFNQKVGDIIHKDLYSYFEKDIISFISKNIKDKFLYSRSFNDFIKHNISKYILEINTVKLSNLVNENNIYNYSKTVNVNLYNILNNNRDMILNWINEKITGLIKGKSLSELLPEKIIENLKVLIADKAIHYTSNSIENYKHNSLEESYNNLNDKIDKNKLNDFSLKLLNLNLHRLLDGNIKNAVSENLNNLPDSKIQKMIKEFMGKELKPITLFGALLGAGTGIGLHYFNISGGISNTITYGVLGFLTNIIAIQMIFHPYNQKQIMKKNIPLTPGIITKNKKKFANSMGQFIDDSLLNTSEIDKILNEKIEDINKEFKNTISKDNYSILVKILKNNDEKISNKAFRYIFNYIKKNNKSMTNLFISNLNNVNMSNYKFKVHKQKIKKETKKMIENSKESILCKIRNFLNDDITLHAKFDPMNKLGVKEQIAIEVNKNLDKTLEKLNNDSQASNYLNNYYEELDKILEKKLKKITNNKTKKKIIGWIKDYVEETINSEETEDVILNYIEDLIYKELQPNKKINELFDGKLIEIAHDNMNSLIGQVFDYIESYLNNNKSNIKRMVKKEIKSNIGFFQKGIYKAIDADKIVNKSINNLINNKLPNFLFDKRTNLKRMFNDFINDLSRKKVSDLNIKLDKNGIRRIVNMLLDNKKITDEYINNFISKIINYIMDIKIGPLLKIVSIEEISDIDKIFNDEIKNIRCSFKKSIYNNKKIIKEKTRPLLIDIFNKLIFNITLKDISNEIKIKNLEQSINNIINIVISSNSFDKNYLNFLDDIFLKIKSYNLSDFFNLDYLSKDLNLMSNKIFSNKKIKNISKNTLYELTQMLITDINMLLSYDSKKYFLNIIGDSISDSVKVNFLDIMNSININEITEKEINNMNPKEIKALFYSFAGKYLKRLQWYGWLGSGIGLLTYYISNFYTP